MNIISINTQWFLIQSQMEDNAFDNIIHIFYFYQTFKCDQYKIMTINNM